MASLCAHCSYYEQLGGVRKRWDFWALGPMAKEQVGSGTKGTPTVIVRIPNSGGAETVGAREGAGLLDGRVARRMERGDARENALAGDLVTILASGRFVEFGGSNSWPKNDGDWCAEA